MNLKQFLSLASKKAAQSADDLSPEELQKLLKNVADNPPPSPLGQGKNLDALMAAKEAAPDASDLKSTYPKNITQDDLAIPPEPMTKDFVMVPEGTGVPAVIPKSPVKAITPEVVEDSKDMVPAIFQQQKKADSGLPVMIEQMKTISPEARNRVDPRFLAALGLTAGAAGYLASENQSPSMTETSAKKKGPSSNVMDDMDRGAEEEARNLEQYAVKEPSKAMGTQATGLQDPGLQQAMEALDRGMASLPKEAEEDPDMKALREAQEKDEERAMMLGLQRAANQIGASLAMTKADQSGIDALEKYVGQKEKNVKSKIATKADKQKLEQARLEMDDDNKLRDSKSDISTTARGIAKMLGINVTDNTSAKQLQDAGLPLGTLLSTKMAADSRKELMEATGEAKKETKEEQNKMKVQSSADKLISQALKSKDYEAYNAANDAINALDAAIASGDKTASGSAFMQFAKIAQGDNSVVRDGDMAVLAGRFNYTSPTEMITKLAAKAKGGNFNATELAQMKAVAERARILKGQRVQKLLSPAVTRLSEAGVNLAESIDPSIIEELNQFKPQTKEAKSEQKETVSLPSKKNPGAIITTKGGKTFKVNADGLTATEQ